jgi:Enoyl-CoA hydratase/isomerase
MSLTTEGFPVSFETLTISAEQGVLFVEIEAPPMNLLGPELVRDLVSLIQHAEADDAVRVLVFKSADPDYFISHVDLTRITEYRAEATKLTGEASIALLFRYLSASRLVIIAQIEGRVRAAGGPLPDKGERHGSSAETTGLLLNEKSARAQSQGRMHRCKSHQGWFRSLRRAMGGWWPGAECLR